MVTRGSQQPGGYRGVWLFVKGIAGLGSMIAHRNRVSGVLSLIQAVMICMDNSDYMRNCDYGPNRPSASLLGRASSYLCA